MAYHNYNRVSGEPIIEYSRESPVLGGLGHHHHSDHRGFNEKIVYEDVIGGSNHHHGHRHHPSEIERVKVVEYDNVPEKRVVYEETTFDYGTNPCYSRPGYY
ncbi:uncharacterized protein LOC114915816 [Cajanus cajan]|uniref:Uncharacterized protein n=1 Tax=Cajanus cajan TaxID=3821 RepID=A0A151TRF3_CAJCA|nr:uncharacterized protein LOC114915816 [Cajanus cajan]KYP69634.1 hypothetical protein KK1_008834 [Cajanus cajan]